MEFILQHNDMTLTTEEQNLDYGYLNILGTVHVHFIVANKI